MNMIEKFKSWIRTRILGEEPPRPGARRTSYIQPSRRRELPDHEATEQQEVVEIDPDVAGTIESNGPGKNVLIRNRFVREETGTHETLKILDDSMIETGEEPGIDPYNTGGFDRSKKWDQRFRK